MAQRLGRTYSRLGRITATQKAPNYDVLLRIPASELLSGSGPGKDYLVVVTLHQGHVFDQNAQRTWSRVGLRFPGYELIDSVQYLHHLQSPMNSVQALPYHIVYPIADWDSGQDLLVFADHLEETAGGLVSTGYSDIVAMVFDLQQLGLSRAGAGRWVGTRGIIDSVTYPTVPLLPETPSWSNILSTGTLSASDGEWLGLFAAQIMPKGIPATTGNLFAVRGLWPSTDTWSPSSDEIEVGVSHRARGIDIGTTGADGKHVYWTGSWVPFTVTTATQSFRMQAQNISTAAGSTQCRIAQARIAAIRIGEFDGFYAERVPGRIANGIGTTPNTLADQVVAWQSGRDLDDLLVLSKVYTSGEQVGSPPRNPIVLALSTFVTIDGWTETGNTVQGSTLPMYYVPAPPEERVPILGAAHRQPSRNPPAGGVTAEIIRTGDPQYPGESVLTYAGYDRTVLALQLSDFGAPAAPSPPTLTRIVFTPGREAQLSALPAFLFAPTSAGVPIPVESWEELVPHGAYRIRWGSAIGFRRVCTLQWVLNRTNALAQYSQVTKTWPRAFKFAHEIDGVLRPWVVRPDSQSIASDSGIYVVSAQVVELTYYSA